ncbi:MAG: hypothetical protein BV459_03840 [Thermoplasmata archaeon M11B2D]|nr:MAG: hypothetical protein BV459_03840 [Thermoplasmata archaeon M11B2D]PNX53675.1 MAG: hypothetical protein BV458_03200 [Thermoplasmata archaeon M9B2D]
MRDHHLVLIRFTKNLTLIPAGGTRCVRIKGAQTCVVFCHRQKRKQQGYIKTGYDTQVNLGGKKKNIFKF